MANISAIKLPDDTSYNIKAVAIPMGKLDTTSTATVMTASIDGITELVNGVCVWLTNGVVTSASNFTININGLGGKPVYQSQAAATRSSTIFNINYTALLIYNEDRVEGGCWDYVYGYDSNTNTIGYQIRTQAVSMPMDSITYRYRLLFQSVDGKKLVPANNSTSTNATSSRTTIQTPIDPFGLIFYYGTTASVAAGSKPNSSYLWQQYNGISLGYSFNTTGSALTMTTSAPIYLKCAPQTNGSAIIDSTTPFVQSLPSSDDGKIYIFLGIAESATAFMLTLEHPIYWYKDGAVRQWTNSVDSDSKVEQVSATPSSYTYWRPLLVGASSNATEGFTPTSVTDKSYTFPTVEVQPSSGTIRINSLALVDSTYKTTLSPTTLTANRTITLPNNSGTIALTTDIPSAATANPIMDGTAAVGSSTKYALEDHVHPTDTSRLAASLKGTANGVAELDENGKVPSSQLPSYVDDVIEGYYWDGSFFYDIGHTIEIYPPESGKIYIELNSGKTYRWSGSAYVEISASLALGETSSTAYRGDRGKTAYDHSQLTSGNPHNVSKSDVGLGNVDNVQQYSASNPPPYPVTSVNSQTGNVTLSIPTKTSDLNNDSGFITGMYIASYGSSTFADISAAYLANKIVYCKASSNADPSSGVQSRMAFLAYVNKNSSNDQINEFEFQYYRSVATHTAAQQGDQVFIYKLNSSGTWSVTTREAYTKVVAGTNMTSSYSSGTITLNATSQVPTVTAADNGKVMTVVDSAWAAADLPIYNGASTIIPAASGVSF